MLTRQDAIKAFFMGGRIPYGFSKAPAVMRGVHTSKYVREESEAEDIQMIFEMYSEPVTTLGDVLRVLPPYNKRGKRWSTARLSEMIRNPAYCRADRSVYEFYTAHGAKLCDPPEDFRGINGLYMFRGENTNRKTWDLSGREIVIALHEGLIDPQLWLRCREKWLRNHEVRTSKPKNSWLCGAVKCGNCGYVAVIKKSVTQAGRHFVCSCAMSSRSCDGIGRTVYADELEQAVKGEIEKKIASLSITSPTEDGCESKKINDCMSVWEIMSFDDKRAVVKILIQRIVVDGSGYHIEWNV